MPMTKWQRFKKLGSKNPMHWTRSNVVSYCAKCDKTFHLISDGIGHRKESGHPIYRKKFYRGQRAKNLNGERNGASKLTVLDVALLRKLYTGNVSTYVLGLFFNISQQAAYMIAKGKTWREAK